MDRQGDYIRTMIDIDLALTRYESYTESDSLSTKFIEGESGIAGIECNLSNIVDNIFFDYLTITEDKDHLLVKGDNLNNRKRGISFETVLATCSTVEEATSKLIETIHNEVQAGKEVMDFSQQPKTADDLKILCEKNYMHQYWFAITTGYICSDQPHLIEHLKDYPSYFYTDTILSHGLNYTLKDNNINGAAFFIQEGADPTRPDIGSLAKNDETFEAMLFLLSHGASEEKARANAGEKAKEYFRAKDQRDKLNNELTHKPDTNTIKRKKI